MGKAHSEGERDFSAERSRQNDEINYGRRCCFSGRLNGESVPANWTPIELYQVVAVPRGICRKNGKILDSCSEIFLLDKAEPGFVSLLNQTYEDNPYEANAIRKTSVRIVAHTMMPYITCDGNSRVGGYVGDIWNLIQEKCQFEYTLRCLEYYKARNITEDGQADVFLSASVAESTLVNSCATQPYIYNWYNLYMRLPELQASSVSYLKTFSTDLWLLMAAIFLLLTATLWLNGKIINHVVKMEPDVSIPSCFLGATAGFLNQGYDLRFRSLSGRGQILVALFTGTILYAAMNAILFSRLAITNVRFPFTSLWDITEKSDLSVCLRNNSFVFETVLTKDGVILPAWEKILNNKNCLDIVDQENIPKIICQKGTIILENRVVMSALTRRSSFSCDVIYFHTKYFSQGNVFVMTRAFKEKRVVEKMMMSLRSYGIFKRLENHHINRHRSDSSTKNWNEVTMEHIQGILLMYFVAIGVSLVVLLVEISIQRGCN